MGISPIWAMLAGVNLMWKPFVGGALAIACGAWAVGSFLGGTGAPPPDTGDPVVVVTSTSPPTESADSRPAGNLDDDDPTSHSSGTGTGDSLDDEERDDGRAATPRSSDGAPPVIGQTGTTADRDDVDGEVEIPRRVEDPDDQNEDDQDEDGQDGNGARGDDDGGGDD